MKNDIEYDETVLNRMGLLLFPEDIVVLRTGRICTVEEMDKWVGDPCDEWTPNCPTCTAWDEWKQCLSMLSKQDTFRKDMKEQESE